MNKHFKNDRQVANKHKKCSISLLTNHMQIRTTIRYTSHPSRWKVKMKVLVAQSGLCNSIHSLLQGTHLTQGLNLGLVHCGQILFCLNHHTVPPLRQLLSKKSESNQFSSVTQSCLTLCDPMNSSMPVLPVDRQLPESTQTYVHWVNDAIQPSHPLSSPSPPPSIFPSIRVLSNESSLCIRWSKYWSFSFNISSSNEHPGLASSRMDWSDLLAIQGTLKSLLQHHSSKASILRRSAFTVQLSRPYMTTGKTIDLTRQTFVGKVMSLLLNMLSRLVITFLPRSKHLLILWLQSPSAVILEPRKVKSATVSTVSPSICHEVWDQMPWS